MTPSQGKIVFALVGLFLLLLLAEAVYPLRTRKRRIMPRLLLNLGLAACAFAIAAALVKPVALSLTTWTSMRSFGLLHLVGLSQVASFGLGFLLMDLTFYYWHLANHRVPMLWRFHNVHHVDPDLDVSTALRFHPGEVLFSVAFRIAQIGLLGVSPLTYVIYESVFQGSTIFHHSNVRLPLRVERLLNVIVVTPRMHGIHHSVMESETNSNYGVVFSWWDLLHRSLRRNVPQAAVVIGVPAYLEPADNTLWQTLTLPFRRQRDYWCWPDGTRPMRDVTPTQRDSSRLLA